MPGARKQAKRLGAGTTVEEAEYESMLESSAVARKSMLHNTLDVKGNYPFHHTTVYFPINKTKTKRRAHITF